MNGYIYGCHVINAGGDIPTNTVTLTVNPAPPPPVITKQPTNQTITAGQNATFSITATGAEDYLWLISTNNGSTWDEVLNGGIYAGVRTATLTLTNVPIGYNGYIYFCQVRNGPSAVNSNKVTLTVNPATPPPTLSVSPTSLSFESSAGSKSFTVTSNITNWSVSSNQVWATVTPASGSNNRTVTVNVATNTSTSRRTATITVSATGVASQTVTVSQDGYIPTPFIDLSVPSIAFDASAASQSFNITSNVEWTVMKSAGASWLTVTPSSGRNDGTVTVITMANNTGAQRTATLTISASGIGQQTVIVTQTNTRVANETVEQQLLKAWVSDGMLYVSGVRQSSTLCVYTITGALIYQGVANGTETHGLQIHANILDRGIYIITDGIKTVKVVN